MTKTTVLQEALLFKNIYLSWGNFMQGRTYVSALEGAHPGAPMTFQYRFFRAGDLRQIGPLALSE
jgi:hypothetical protein